MKWKGFTHEENVLLRNNPYTLKVTERTIRFTLPFKQYMLEGLQHGKSPATIVQELGYDPTIFGQSRLSGIAYRSACCRHRQRSARGRDLLLHEQ